MLVLIDNANLKEIERLYSAYPYDGVTTNPSILKAAGENPIALLKSIKDIIPKGSQLHAQVISKTAEDMLVEAEYMAGMFGEDFFVKVPVTPEGLKAMHLISQKGISITATAIYTPMQGFMAAKAGAKYTAPYVNRLDNMGANGVQVAKDIHDMFKIHNLNACVLAASFKNTQQILELCKYGIGSVTAAPDVLSALVLHDVTTLAVEKFTQDFYDLAGQGKTMLDVE